MAYTTIDDPSQYFQTALWTGNGSARAITNDGNSDLQPDWIWGKNRSDTNAHWLMDSTRGVDKRIISSESDAEDDPSTDILTAFGSDGFSLGTNTEGNKSGDSYVAWQWKANGGTTSTNDASATGVGTIDSVYQANTTAGFSIVTHTGSGSSGTIAHGLGAAPKWVLTKNRTDNSQDWAIYHVGLSSAEYYIRLNTTGAQVAGSSVWGDTAPSSTVITLGGANGKNNASSKNYVSYCFAPIQGYSKFGSWIGNANTDGPFIYTGFKPAWILYKGSSLAENWIMFDTKRDPHNLTFHRLDAERNNAESTNTGSTNPIIDILSNGFKIRGSGNVNNGSGETYIYAAFAEHPFVSSEGVPVTAR